MLDTHVLQQGEYGVMSPLDDLESSTQVHSSITIGMNPDVKIHNYAAYETIRLSRGS
jgi:hypothetical protein